MVVVQGCFVVAGNSQWSADELEDGAKDDSQHAIIPDGGPVRGPVPNRFSISFRELSAPLPVENIPAWFS